MIASEIEGKLLLEVFASSFATKDQKGLGKVGRGLINPSHTIRQAGERRKRRRLLRHLLPPLAF